TMKERIQATMATTYKDQARPLMSKTFSSKMSIFNNQKVADHHAIIPTEVSPVMSHFSTSALKSYDMIVHRLFEALMPQHESDALTVTLEVAGHRFVLKENVTTVLGFKSIRQCESITEMQQPF
ncbi:DNA topoisomerase, partial [Staphylococcus aureus]|uniref:DNA topoisomerase n=1 Tax=Staphylococcus aureus TaxID=1280 RepID=UPI000A9359AD